MKITCLLICLGFGAIVGAQTALPEGKGKAILEDTCQACHGLDQVQGRAWTAARWTNVVGEMEANGAMLSADDKKTLLDYLIANFPPLNVNKATADQLQTTLSLSDKDAAAIISYRMMHGDFKNWDDLKKVPGIDPARLDGIKDSVAF